MHTNRFLRGLLIALVLLSLLSGLVGPRLMPALAAPQKQTALNVVISEFRTIGPGGGTDEFVEIYNSTATPIDISGWQIFGSNNAGANSSRVTVPALTTLQSGQHYLFANKDYTGPTPGDITYGTGISDDGGIALKTNSGTIVDQVGMSSGSAFKEGTILSPLVGNVNQSYERVGGGCSDTNNNVADFFLNPSTSNPQNSSSIIIACPAVKQVYSVNGTYKVGDPPIKIFIEFTTNVNVTGAPQLLLETGPIDHSAVYSGGDGTSVLTFNYTVQSGDTASDLDYVASDSLSLNGGTITGAVGNANLTLPVPGATGSLSNNNNVVIDNGSAPTILSFTRQTPIASITNSSELTFRATFSEQVKNVDSGDFVITGVTGITVDVSPLTPSNLYNITVSGVNLGSYNGNVGLDFSASPTITDSAGNPFIKAEPPIDEIYTVDHIAPTVTVEQATSQADPTDGTPINFTVTFSEPINVATFTADAVAQNNQSGYATGITWRITDSGDHQVFTLSAIAIVDTGTKIVQPSIIANTVSDLAGNLSSASTSVDNSVTFKSDESPTVTITQATAQPDPTNLLPIKFTVVFSEAIISNIFTPSDITQTGTATGITWAITDSGDHTTFTISATAITRDGTVVPFIAANRVTDLVGNNNKESNTDSVTYDITGPTVQVEQAFGQLDPTTSFPVKFTVTFGEPINVSSFTAADISLAGTATGPTWTITDLGDHKTFTLAATALTRNGILQPYITAGKVTDLLGNNNSASTSVDNSVTTNIVLPTPQKTLTPTATQTPPQTIIINEVAWMGTASDHEAEWIELWNPNSVAINLNGWKIKTIDGVPADIILNGSIPANGFYLIAHNTSFQLLKIDLLASFDLEIEDGESLQLIDASNVIIDTVNPDGGKWPAGVKCSNSGSATPVPNTCATMERDLSKGFGDAHWYTFADNKPTVLDGGGQLIRGTPGYANWAISVTATPTKAPVTSTPTRKPGIIIPTPTATVVINEFLPRAGFDWNQDGKVDVFDEFIEIANLGPVDVNLSGWKLDDAAGQGSNPYTLPAKILKPGERIVFYASQTNVLLSDGGDTVRLLNPNNVIKDARSYSVVKVADVSWCRLPDINGSWFADCFPTPNQRNSRTGEVPATPPGTGLEEQPCLLPDTLPEPFRQAECNGFGVDMWQSMYWDILGWFKEFLVPQNDSKWETFVE